MYAAIELMQCTVPQSRLCQDTIMYCPTDRHALLSLEAHALSHHYSVTGDLCRCTIVTSLEASVNRCTAVSLAVTGGPCRSMHHSLTITAGPCSSMHHCPDTSNVALSLEAMQMHHLHCPYRGPCRCATVKT